jgi:hypothetical protein
VSVADLPLEVRTPHAGAHDHVVALCRGFLTQADPLTRVTVAVGDAEGLPQPPDGPDGGLRIRDPGLAIWADEGMTEVGACVEQSRLPWLVAAVLRTVYCNLIARRSGIALHAAGVLRDGQAYVFAGRSGRGKTTVARLSEPYPLLDDDLVLIRQAGGAFAAYTSPAWARSLPGLDEAGRYPLAAIYCLRHGQPARLRPIAPAEAVARILTLPPGATPAVCDRLLATCSELAEGVPCFELTFAADSRIWELIARGD